MGSELYEHPIEITEKYFFPFFIHIPLIYDVATSKKITFEYQPSGAGGTHSPPATPHRLQRHTACKIQNGPYIYGRSRQLSPNKFFDLSTPSMRKLDDGGKTNKQGLRK